jgi:hypothetical protein
VSRAAVGGASHDFTISGKSIFFRNLSVCLPIIVSVEPELARPEVLYCETAASVNGDELHGPELGAMLREDFCSGDLSVINLS